MCIHDVSWFVRQLGTELARLLTVAPARPLDDTLASAIAATRHAHEHSCDLTNPDGPSATVVAVRQRNGQLDYLALADSPLIVDTNGRVHAITDDRTAHLADYSVEGVRAARNHRRPPDPPQRLTASRALKARLSRLFARSATLLARRDRRSVGATGSRP